MIKSTVIYLEPKDFNETFDQITFANYARYAKSETLQEIEQADMALIGDVVVKNRSNGCLGKITPITATR